MTTNQKSDKELAFLQDLFIAPDWGERFAELIDEHVKLPKEGEALYIAAGTGGHAMAMYERAGEKLQLLFAGVLQEDLLRTGVVGTVNGKSDVGTCLDGLFIKRQIELMRCRCRLQVHFLIGLDAKRIMDHHLRQFF